MGGTLDWAALPWLVELLGIEDIELYVAQLCAWREYNRSQRT